MLKRTLAVSYGYLTTITAILVDVTKHPTRNHLIQMNNETLPMMTRRRSEKEVEKCSVHGLLAMGIC